VILPVFTPVRPHFVLLTIEHKPGEWRNQTSGWRRFPVQAESENDGQVAPRMGRLPNPRQTT
jgi:hypothetical protein